MKIGIFGCSFADETLPYTLDSNLQSWSSYLRVYGYDVTNFGVKGSSVWYSYDLYCRHHNNFDLILFLETAAGRYYAENIKTHLVPTLQHITGNKLEVANFYKFIFNKKYDEAMIELMIRQVKSNPKVTHIVAMDTLGKVSRLENKIYNFRPELGTEQDNRFCHLSDLNNRSLAAYIHKCISNNTPIKLDSDWHQIPTVEDRHKYFIPK